MILDKIWERKIFFKILLSMGFLLIALYSIFICIDFSIHSIRLFTYSKVPLISIAIYYLHYCIKYLYLLLPLTLMLATVRVFLDMNMHNEITALKMAGISTGKLIRPAFFMATLISLSLFINEEFVLPHSNSYIMNFKENHLKRRAIKEKVITVLLKDNSKLVYQNEDQGKLLDVFWIRSASDIWHMKSFHPITKEGFFVEHLKREKDFFEKKESFKNYSFPEIILQQKTLKKTPKPIDCYSTSELIKSAYLHKFSSHRTKAMLLTQLNYKMALPLIPILTMLFMPSILNFSRRIPLFFIYAVFIFGFIFAFTLLDSALILGENQTFSPYLTIWAPMVFLLSTTLYSLQWKIRHVG